MGSRKAVNLSMDAALLERAKALNINLSQALEPHLRELVREAEAEAWRQEHRAAIGSWNDWIEANGIPLQDQRAW